MWFWNVLTAAKTQQYNIRLTPLSHLHLILATKKKFYSENNENILLHLYKMWQNGVASNLFSKLSIKKAHSLAKISI